MSKKKTAPEQLTNEEMLSTSTVATNDQPVAEQVVEPEKTAAENTATTSKATENATESVTETATEEESAKKGFFTKIGEAMRNFFVSLGRKIRNFFVNLWRKTVKFFHNVGIFFKMLFTLKRKKKPADDVTVEAEQTAMTEENSVANMEKAVVTDESGENLAADQQAEAEVEEIDYEAQEIEAMKSRFKHFFRKRTKDEWKTFLLGNNEQKGFLQKFISYALLILFGFVYAYPMLYMLAYSLMGESDVMNPMVNFWPTEWQWSNYREAAQTLNFFNTLLQTAYISVLPAIFQTIACGLTAYGLARFNFPGKKIVFGLIVLTFIIPPQLTMMPQLMIFTNLKFSGTVLAFMIPAAVGQGIKSAVFILIFYQFFKGIPDSVIEAAKIDGANSFQIFVRIGIRSALPAILLSFLLSVVWYYNETVLSSVYLGNSVKMLPLELEKFQSTYNSLITSTTGKSVNEAVYMAGTLLNVLPLIIMYFFTQRYFLDGIDKAGITGE